MTNSTISAAAALLALTLSGAATAQTGVYVRGDVGYAWSRDDRFVDGAPTSASPAFGLGASGAAIGSGGDFDRAAGFQIGAGYTVSPLFRADLTLGYRPGFAFAGANSPALFGGTNSQSFSADVKNTTVMLTGYLDLAGLAPGAFGVFQPYVGVGVGYARNSLSGAVARSTGTVPAAQSGTYTLPGQTESGFAWSLTAGTAYRITAALSVDVGYRYLDLGKVSTGLGNSTGTGAFASGPVTSKVEADLRAHELTVGVRYSF